MSKLLENVRHLVRCFFIIADLRCLVEVTQPPSAKPATSQLATVSPVLAEATTTTSPTATEPNVRDEVRAKLKRIADLLPDASEHLSGATDVLLESSEVAVYIDKQWKPAQVWVLSHGCLIANRKAKVSITQGVKQKISFERFVPFDKCSLSDVKDTPDLQNCFKLKGLAGSVFLHTPDAGAKAAWYSTIEARIKEINATKERPRKQLQEDYSPQRGCC